MQRFFIFSALLGVLATHAQAAEPKPEPKPDFNHDVRPILSQFCFKCHGMDDKTRKADLRFDMRESALQVITPGKPDQSEFIKRVFTHDPDEVMPPPAAKMTISDTQKQTLRNWVASGAEYAPHWAFVAPKMPAVPPLKEAKRAANPIDNFILARLEKAGLAPSPETDRYTLVRRVSLDLIGLPPTPQEADSFVKDTAPDAYEKLIDRLLASPQYGERWARRWLDLARYADTNGYEKDRTRTIWPYRDWVVRALNNNLPFDQFTVKQLAGDLLPNASPDDLVATGFHRNTMLNEEGGIDPLEFRYHAMTDRVATTGTTWLGLTTGCAQCHTHKFDPIQHKEYFQFMAFMNNADEPDYEIPDATLPQRQSEARERLQKMLAELPSKWPLPGEVSWQTPKANAIAQSGAPVEAFPDGTLRFGGAVPEKDVYTLTLETPGAADRLKLEVLTDGAAGPGRTAHGNFVLNEISVSVASKEDSAKSETVKIARAEADYSQERYSITGTIDGKPESGWAIDQGGNAHKNRTATFYFDKPVDFAAGTRWTIKLIQNYGMQHVIGKLRLSLGESKAVDTRPADIVRREAMQTRFAAWEKGESAKATSWQILKPATMKSSSPYLALQPDGSVLAGGDITKSDVYDLKFAPATRPINAIRLEVLPNDNLPGGGPGLAYYEGARGEFFLSEFHILVNGERLKVRRATQSFPKGDGAAKTQDGDMSSGWSTNGALGQANAAVFQLEKPITANSALELKLMFERHFAAALGHFRISVTDNPDAEARGHDAPTEEVLVKPIAGRSDAEQTTLFTQFLKTAPELTGARETIKQASGLPRGQSTLVMRERPATNPRQTFLHLRGEFTQPADEVQPGVPAFLPPLPQGAARNRLTFAKWLVAPDNPLTARVTVNRQWQAFFGRGLVRTLDDFGYQGETPSHPELLDWLALKFASGDLPTVNGQKAQAWDVKALHKLMVMSATYRQTSRVTPELLERDPQNILLARGPRFRLDAEVIRDGALKASSLLSAKMGGPGVYPPQPDGVTEVAYGNPKWNASTGEDRYRRSLYTFVKRTAPFAMFNTFDAPTGESCLARREVSNTPLQALVLLNDVMFQEAAQALGRLAVAEAKTPQERATLIFRHCLTRPPDKDELAKLLAFADKQRARIAAKPTEAVALAGAGPNAEERAIWTATARGLLNLDETVTKS